MGTGGGYEMGTGGGHGNGKGLEHGMGRGTKNGIETWYAHRYVHRSKWFGHTSETWYGQRSGICMVWAEE